MEVICDPNLRMRRTLNMAVAQEVNQSIPINRYYRSLNEIYRVAGFCMEDKDYEKAFIYYMRFVSLSIDELPKHKQYKSFSSSEKIKAEATLRDALLKAELLKEQLKKKYEEEAAKAKQNRDKIAANAVMKHRNDVLPDHDIAVIQRIDLSDYMETCLENTSEQRNLNHKKVVVAGDLVEHFMRLAQMNTDRNVETCGILCGSMVSGRSCHITHAVVPKQTGGSDSCDTRNEEEVFAYQDANNLVTLGWIHTHPSQTAFLSSVDLHTHCSYQMMLPEAIAIVVAPKVGVFRLSERGMKEIGECRKTGFHPHKDSSALFLYCDDVHFESSFGAVVVDLR
ncbi:unnamed protein product [Thelazia callipaeda]|uniref:MPN domain-containing protein n=1 Tax=Thelazia callipaeda TaxID=103827 RepID=A0A0N5D2I9_THECL|nr:unnamed protein product [Thelazia callipaeda]